MANITVKYNKEKNGIELYFDGKPEESILTLLKDNGFRWSFKQKMWYAKANDATQNVAKSIASDSGFTTDKAETSDNENAYNLFNMTLTDGIGNNYNKSLDTKEIAAIVRKHIKDRFPMVKFSVVSTYGSICAEVKSSPFAEDSECLKAIMKYVDAYTESFRVCTCFDPYGDYGSSYNFHFSWCRTSYQYIQTEETVSIHNMIEEFNVSKAIHEEEESARKELETLARIAKEEEERKECERIEAERRANHKKVEEAAIVKSVDPYYVNKLSDNGNSKACSVSSYMDHQDYKHTCRVNKEVYLTKEQYEIFSNQLLDDWSFIDHTGGSFTKDNRIQSMTDYHAMSEDERKTVKWCSDKCVAIFCDGKMMFVVDAQGYSYCRYVYMVGEETEIANDNNNEQVVTDGELEGNKLIAHHIEGAAANIMLGLNLSCDTFSTTDWNLFACEMRLFIKNSNIHLNKRIIQAIPSDALGCYGLKNDALKAAMYKLYGEMYSVQNQFAEANIGCGQRVTFVSIGEFGGIHVSRVTFETAVNSTYAQYKDVVKATFRPERKRNSYYKFIRGDILVYNGWLEDLPDDLLWETVMENSNAVMRKYKFTSFDHNMIDLALEYYKSRGNMPIINTYNPDFC